MFGYSLLCCRPRHRRPRQPHLVGRLGGVALDLLQRRMSTDGRDLVHRKSLLKRCHSGLSFLIVGAPISSPIRRIRSDSYAPAASGHAAAL
jgi:hypothetical protein